MMDFLCKRILGKCHPMVIVKLPFASGAVTNYHNKALHPFCEDVRYQQRLFNRSLYSYILMYNRLPQVFVDLPTVRDFQSALTHQVKLQAMLNQESSRRCFQSMQAIADMFGYN